MRWRIEGDDVESLENDKAACSVDETEGVMDVQMEGKRARV